MYYDRASIDTKTKKSNKSNDSVNQCDNNELNDTSIQNLLSIVNKYVDNLKKSQKSVKKEAVTSTKSSKPVPVPSTITQLFSVRYVYVILDSDIIHNVGDINILTRNAILLLLMILTITMLF